MKTLRIVLTVAVALGVNAAFANANENCSGQFKGNLFDKSPQTYSQQAASALGNDKAEQEETRTNSRGNKASR